jgi:hypothetical protein
MNQEVGPPSIVQFDKGGQQVHHSETEHIASRGPQWIAEAVR